MLIRTLLDLFKFTSKSITASDLCDSANWVVIGAAGKVDVVMQNLKSLLEQNRVMYDATIAMVSRYLKPNDSL